MPAKTHLFLCLKDNYGVLVHDPDSGATAAIDAPEAAPVEAALKTTGWRLSDILVTPAASQSSSNATAAAWSHRTAKRRAFRSSTRPCARTTRPGSAASRRA